MFGFGEKKKPLTPAQRKRKAEKRADAIIDFFIPNKNSRPKPGYKHRNYLAENYQKALRDARKKRR